MLADPKILILDEATSRLDAYSESLVQDAQERLFSNRTTIVIAHRLTTIANASKIMMFDHGELIEEGTHAELLARGGQFKDLYETYYSHQGLEEISEEVAEVAKSQVEKHGGEKPEPSGVGMMMMGMGGGMGAGMGHGGMGQPSPEMIEKMKERYKSDPDSIPAPMREMLKQMIEADDMGDKKDKPKDDEYSRSKTQQQGPIGSGRPSPQMMKELMEKYKQDPSSVPEHMHAHFEKMIKEEEDKE